LSSILTDYLKKTGSLPLILSQKKRIMKRILKIMTAQKLTLEQLLDLIDLEDYRGIIDKNAFLKVSLEKGIPRVVSDIRGALRLVVDRLDNGFSVTQYPTELANESIGEVYSISGAQNHTDEYADLDIAA
jgi:high-affinity Fe2+/Pb2+ permease